MSKETARKRIIALSAMIGVAVPMLYLGILWLNKNHLWQDTKKYVLFVFKRFVEYLCPSCGAFSGFFESKDVHVWRVAVWTIVNIALYVAVGCAIWIGTREKDKRYLIDLLIVSALVLYLWWWVRIGVTSLDPFALGFFLGWWTLQ